MIDNSINNKKSIKYYIKKYLFENKNRFENKVVIDIPAGNGATTELLCELGATVKPFDLFPEYFLFKNINCEQADVTERIPLADGFADALICQEGIEHFSDQLKTLKEFNRVLKKGAELIITTPSYSNLASKFSYLLFESETTKQMPPNEINDIWMSEKEKLNKIYHGHIFLIGLQKLRILAKLSGFKISKIKYVRLSKSSLLLLPVFYLIILLSSYIRYYANLNKNKEVNLKIKKAVYKEQLRINISVKNLINKHIFVIFEKENRVNDVDFRFESMIKKFGEIM